MAHFWPKVAWEKPATPRCCIVSSIRCCRGCGCSCVCCRMRNDYGRARGSANSEPCPIQHRTNGSWERVAGGPFQCIVHVFQGAPHYIPVAVHWQTSYTTMPYPECTTFIPAFLLDQFYKPVTPWVPLPPHLPLCPSPSAPIPLCPYPSHPHLNLHLGGMRYEVEV